jgi:hypothetical protein
MLQAVALPLESLPRRRTVPPLTPPIRISCLSRVVGVRAAAEVHASPYIPFLFSVCYFEHVAATIFTDSTVNRCDPADDVLVDEPALAAEPELDEEPVLDEDPGVDEDPVAPEPVVPASRPVVVAPEGCPADAPAPVDAELDSRRPVISTC